MSRLAAGVLVALVATGCSAPGSTDPAPTPAPAPADPSADATTSSPSPTPDRPARTMPAATATSAGELLRRLVAAEQDTRDATVEGPALEAAAFETQVLYRELARRPAWQADVLAQAPPALRPAVQAHLHARVALRSILSELSDTLPAWRIVEPTPLAELEQHYREAARRYGVAWEVLAAINFVETGFGKIRGLSSAGAQGPMQFMPATWEIYGEGDVLDPHDAIMAAARYLADRGGAEPGGLPRALHAYNQHQGYVDGVTAYVDLLRYDPGALRGLHRWQIVFLSDEGDVWLPVGHHTPQRVGVGDYLREHPERHLGRETG